jgi:hypothetical protein
MVDRGSLALGGSNQWDMLDCMNVWFQLGNNQINK